eukprot:5911131-Pyramimonas_sp.AAC.1
MNSGMANARTYPGRLSIRASRIFFPDPRVPLRVSATALRRSATSSSSTAASLKATRPTSWRPSISPPGPGPCTPPR